MSIYTNIVANVLFPLHERLKGHSTVAVRRQMELSQWWSAEELRELQLQRLKSLLQHARQHVPYYRDLFERLDFDPANVESLVDLQQLPLLEKAYIRTTPDLFKANNARGLARFNTGGSSGQPLIFFIGKQRVSHDVAAKWRATRWWGVDIGDPEIVIWGSPIEHSRQDKIKQIRDRLLRTELLPAFEMSPEKLDHFVDEIRRLRPKMLFGYPSALSYIARHALQRNVRLDDVGIKVAFVTSEKLYDEQRELIQRVFACPVANGYGGRDAGFIAHECPNGGMHLTAEDIIVEIVDAEGNVLPAGLSGEIVVTHLSTGDFPFIRYRTGDVGVMDSQPCSCGRGLPLLKEIQGRATDFIVAADGTVMHGLALIYTIRDLPGVNQFKITQHSRQLIEVLLVTDSLFDFASFLHIKENFRRRLGRDVDVKICNVDKIEPEKSGKYRYVISKISPGDLSESQ